MAVTVKTLLYLRITSKQQDTFCFAIVILIMHAAHDLYILMYSYSRCYFTFAHYEA